MWPADADRPESSSLNYQAGQAPWSGEPFEPHLATGLSGQVRIKSARVTLTPKLTARDVRGVLDIRGLRDLRGVRVEALLLAGLAACGAALLAAGVDAGHERAAWAAVLSMQAVPYAMALLCRRLGASADVTTRPPRRVAVAAE